MTLNSASGDSPVILLLFTFHQDFGIQIILKLIKRSLNPLTTKPAKDISLTVLVKSGNANVPRYLKYDLEEDFNIVF